MQIVNLGPRELPNGRVEVQIASGSADFDLPLELAFHQAQHARPRDLLFWNDEATGLIGFHSKDVRVAWMRGQVVEGWIVTLRPGRNGEGLAGLEIRLTSGAELPILAVTPWRDEALQWLLDRKGDLESVLDLQLGRRDYGRQD